MVVGPGLAASAMSTNLSGAEVATDVRAPECGIGGPLVCASLGMVDRGTYVCVTSTHRACKQTSRGVIYTWKRRYWQCPERESNQYTPTYAQMLINTCTDRLYP